MIQTLEIREALYNLTTSIAEASRDFDEWFITGSEYLDPSWRVERCFLQILAIVEAMELRELRKMILTEYTQFKRSKDGFGSTKMGPEEPYSACLSRLRCYLHAVQSFFPQDKQTKVTKDLLQIIRDIHYVITDRVLFGGPPRNENDVHLRIEGILKCFFADMKHKPTLTKSIKNFEPDTGIPSIRTLIEYKFLSRREDIALIADQILADTRGYISRDWDRFLYVLYETNRFRPEKEWNQLLRQSGVAEHTTIVVLSGEPVAGKRKKQIRRKVP